MSDTDPDAALERMMAKVAATQEELARVRSNGEALGGQVRVTVDIDGRITDLVLDPALHALHLSDVAAAITAAHTTALTWARAAASEIQRDLHEDPYVAAIAHRTATAGLRKMFARKEPRATYTDTEESHPPQVSESGW
ncbi:YbaB/EbfC family nucleoid-associated protein [Nocardia sp. CA2R105]|uniref:YbaB/EbfC family nucleoid-associated protein n=1 Tax=Nocardia coffeae TaxID=2873381 RepID=UPI001CA755AB|nr:YbaB/EbfC family nucleoid-associated protein [Nocardia coffeae]MBY8862179.1 YbaB/EbfC family nucleoid-associated protein [Nocardia coffeae]